MIRMLNFVCVALMGLSILSLYHVSEKTRVAHMELAAVNRQIADTSSAIAVLQAEWGRAASPDRIQQLAGQHGMNDGATAQLSAFDQLPQRGQDAPLNNDPVRNANAELPAPPPAAPSDSAVQPGF